MQTVLVVTNALSRHTIRWRSYCRLLSRDRIERVMMYKKETEKEEKARLKR